MAVVINPQHEEAHQLTKEEAWAFFDKAVQERLGISAKEFLKRRDEFKCNPHFNSLIIMLPLAENASK